MSGFSADWLALREPLDAASRATELTWAFGRALPPGARLVDLGAGTGSNLRFLAPRIGRIRQDWLLVENDPALLEAGPRAIAAWAAVRGGRGDMGDGAVAVEGMPVDGGALSLTARYLAADLGAWGGMPDFDAADGVTASALFDLVSQGWLDRFTARLVAARRPPVLAALTVDGRLVLTPDDPDDAAVASRFHTHMRRDKGLGPALGPAAPAALHRTLSAAGYGVWSARSDWLAGPEHQDLQARLIDGYAAAAAEADPAFADRAHAWGARRLAMVDGGGLTIRVGHADIVAVA